MYYTVYDSRVPAETITTILMKELGDTIYNTTAFVQHLIRTEES